ncbi:MAG: T9SS type A sorting domain-containing protein [Bacteroidales bacterium]|nr:T9SS type A sorting domain-containing protein [Bacteroidales bacterium]MDZ4204090.1 T9SS type A sorting domain-containing protein [Bacteroidales bacterium]
MKKLILIFIVLLLNSYIVNSQDYWENLNTPPGIGIFSIAVNSNENIFIGISYTTGGGLYKSTDNGVSWVLLGFENEGISKIEINELGYIYVYGGPANTIYRSIDNGLTWDALYESIQGGSSMNSFPGGLLFASGGTGTYVNVIRSVDYGITWEEVLIFPSNTEYPYDIEIQNIDTIYIGTINFTGGGGVYRSVDGGDSWEHIGLTDHYVSSLAMNSSGDLFAGTRGHYSLYEGGVYVLPKGQTEWVNLKDDELVTSMVINSEDEIYIGCSTLDYFWGGVRRSIDNGQTWEDISLETMYDRDIEGLVLGPEEHLYAFEYYSPTPLYKSVNSTINSLPGNQIEKCNKTYNYPNPFSGETTIYYSFKIDNPVEVQIAIYNSQGNKIQDIILPKYFGKEQSIKWNPKELPAGIYYYELSAGSIHTFKKMVFQK